MAVSGSLAVQNGISGSLFGTSSWAVSSSWAASASWTPNTSIAATYVSNSISSSWASSSYQSRYATSSISASWASQSLNSFSATSASYASASTSASYAITASYLLNSNYAIDTAAIPKAWALIMGTASLDAVANRVTMYNPRVISGYNVSSVAVSRVVPVANPKLNPASGNSANNYDTTHNWIINFTNPLPSTNYMVMPGQGGEMGWESLPTTMFPLAQRSTSAFTMSQVPGGYNADFATGGNPEVAWFSFVVYHNP